MQPLRTKLHIVSFDVPWPADYGGAIDVFYKIKALSEAGAEIYLHCYAYGRAKAAELEQYCAEVWYYPRNTGLAGLSFSLPYIVSSRNDGTLLQRLRDINAPILFEGVHTTRFLNDAQLRSRFKIIRTHNIEHSYYLQLYKKEKPLFKKLFFLSEAYRLKKYENRLQNAQAFFSLSLADQEYFSGRYPASQHYFIPPFHIYDTAASNPGTGNYCLYHGNLSHPENREACLYLLKEVFCHISVPLIIAGKNPGNDIIHLCSQLANCRLVPNPPAAVMENLVAGAQVHVLPTFQRSGMKLKLLSALYAGRHVLVNKDMVYGTGLADGCILAGSTNEFILETERLYRQPFTLADADKRKQLLHTYNNTHIAQKIMAVSAHNQ